MACDSAIDLIWSACPKRRIKVLSQEPSIHLNRSSPKPPLPSRSLFCDSTLFFANLHDIRGAPTSPPCALDFSQIWRQFCGIFRTHKIEASNKWGKFRRKIRKKIRNSNKIFCQNSLCRRATLTNSPNSISYFRKSATIHYCVTNGWCMYRFQPKHWGKHREKMGGVSRCFSK